MSRVERVDMLLRQIEHETKVAFDEHGELLSQNARLKAENAKLQASNEVIAEDHAALCEQNAKLRELVQGLQYCAHEAYGMCARVPVGGERPFTCCPLYDFDAKEYRCEKLMLDLGVEQWASS